MPTVLRVHGYAFFFFSHEGTEPAHIHVRKAGATAKFWLNPVKLAVNDGFRLHEIHRVLRLVEKHKHDLIHAWNHIA